MGIDLLTVDLIARIALSRICETGGGACDVPREARPNDILLTEIISFSMNDMTLSPDEFTENRLADPCSRLAYKLYTVTETYKLPPRHLSVLSVVHIWHRMAMRVSLQYYPMRDDMGLLLEVAC